MSRTNVKTRKSAPRTHEGGLATRISPEEELQRTIVTCLLWEDTFYESGVSIVERIKSLVPQVSPEFAYNLAIDARNKYKLRHAPLLLVREMARNEAHKYLVADALYNVIQRADELTEFLSIYWQDRSGNKKKISNQVKKGLAKAFTKFDAYQLGKYNRDKDVKLRDVLFLTHPKPIDREQAKVWKKLAENTLESPDTWEVNLSSGKEKKETFERLISENKLGALALLRNLRNMKEAGVRKNFIFDALSSMNTSRVLPYRFISAADHAPEWEPELETQLFKSLDKREKLSGNTIVLVDVSGSMTSGSVSSKSTVTPADVASSLAVLAKELSENCKVFVFGTLCKEIPARRGFALRSSAKQNHGVGHGTNIFQSIQQAYREYPNADRCIVITDCQSQDSGSFPFKNNYVINVSPYKNSIAYRKNVVEISGWSEATLDYIRELEKL